MGWQEEIAGQIQTDKQNQEKTNLAIEKVWQKFQEANAEFLEAIRLTHTVEYEQHRYLRGYNCKKESCEIRHCVSSIQLILPEKAFFIDYDKKSEKLYGWDRNAFIGELRYFMIDDSTPQILIENALQAKSDLADGIYRLRFFSPG